MGRAATERNPEEHFNIVSRILRQLAVSKRMKPERRKKLMKHLADARELFWQEMNR